MSSTRHDPEGDLMGVIPRAVSPTVYYGPDDIGLTATETKVIPFETQAQDTDTPSPEYVYGHLASMRAVLAEIKQRHQY